MLSDIFFYTFRLQPEQTGTVELIEKAIPRISVKVRFKI